jgi:DNA-binding transcriptional LysR family regulator
MTDIERFRVTETRIRRRLKLRDLDTLLIIAECGSMAKAASQLAISQPAVSKIISDMEHTLGVRLLDRTTRGVEPTVYGQAVLKCAAAVFDDVRQGVKQLEFLADPAAGDLRIGAAEPMLGGFLSAVIAQVSRRYPRVTFEVTQRASRAQMLRDLRERRFDLIVGRVVRDQRDDDLTTEVLFDEPWSVVVGPRNPLARRRKLNLRELLNEPWTLPPADTVVGAYLTEAFRAAGLDRPRSVMITASVQMHQALMARGRFLAIFPRSLLEFSAGRMALKVLPVELPGQPPPVGIIMLKNRMQNPTVQLFVAAAREIAKPLSSPGLRRRGTAPA